MNRDDFTELHYIAPLTNLPSILKYGILSHQSAQKLDHDSVAMQEIQDRRALKRIPNGLLLHAYANLYFHARNPMLYKRQARHRELCVLCVDTSVMDLPGVIVTTGNAASEYTAFKTPSQGLLILDKDEVFAEYWTSPDQIEQWRRGRIKCSEVLVPGKVPAQFIMGARVSCSAARDVIGLTCPELPTIIDEHLFFFG